MGIWTNELTVMTKEGLNLIARTPSGASYELVRAIAGSGRLEPDAGAENPTGNLAEKLSELKDVCEPIPEFDGNVTLVEYIEDQKAKITSTFNNALLTNPFECWQIGVYAREAGKEEDVLFMIKQAVVKDDIPARAVMPLNITHRDVVFVGGANGIKYDPPDELLVYQAEFKLVREMAEEALRLAREAVSGNNGRRVINMRDRNENRPTYGVGEETVIVALEASPYTGRAETTIMIDGAEYDANISTNAELALSGTIIIERVEE